MKFELSNFKNYDEVAYNVIEALIFNEDRNDYTEAEYEDACKNIIVEEPDDEYECTENYTVYDADKRNLYFKVQIMTRANEYIANIYDTLADEEIVILNTDFSTRKVVYIQDLV